MPDDAKNKLAGMIALKQDSVVKSPPKPAKPKAPPPPRGADKNRCSHGKSDQGPRFGFCEVRGAQVPGYRRCIGRFETCDTFGPNQGQGKEEKGQG